MNGLIGPIITAGIIAVSHVLSLPWLSPTAFLTLSVVLAAFLGGVRSGLVSATFSWAYIAYFFSKPGEPFSYRLDEDVPRILEWGIVLPAMAIMVGYLRDRVARLGAERIRREFEERTLAVVGASMDGIISIDHHGRVIDFNPAAENTFGCTREQAIGADMATLIVPAHLRERHRRAFAEHLATGKSTILGQRLELTALRADGSEFPAEVTVTRVQIDGAPMFTAFVRDITERKAVERERQRHADRTQALTRRLVTIRDAEQRRLSVELHDRIGQTLTALAIDLGLMERNLPMGAESFKERLDDSRALVEDAVSSVRNLIGESRPSELDYGLLAALQGIGEQTQARCGLEVEVTGEEPSPRLGTEVEGMLFRIAQEALTNVVKHASARRVQIELRSRDGGCTLRVVDDGVGFDPAQPPGAQPHWGLEIMRERAESVGARLRLESSAGGGTRVEVNAVRSPPP